ncbi:MAG: hypothetical protein ACF8Q5_11520 [Phycisphaerales bacterium JB040]
MTGRGSLLLELVIALGIFTACSMLISGVLARTVDRVEEARVASEARDLAYSTLHLIELGTISAEAADRLSEFEVYALTREGEDGPDRDPRFEVLIDTQPSEWRDLTLVGVTVVRPDSERALARADGLVNLARVRAGRSQGVGG